MSCPNHPLFLSIADGVLGRVGVVAGFYLEKNERSAIPGNDVDFPALGTVSASHYPVAERPDVINSQNLGTAPERQQAVEKERKRHESGPAAPAMLRHSRNRIRNRSNREIRLLFINDQRRRETNRRSAGAENQQAAAEAFIKDPVTKLA